VDLVRDHLLKIRKVLPNKFVFISGLAGLTLDADMILFYGFREFLGIQLKTHRIFFHNMWIPLISLLIFISLYYYKKKNLGKVFLMIFIGTSVHLLLDATIVGKIIPLYPLSSIEIGLNLISITPDLGWNITSRNLDILLSVDAILLTLWLIHEEREHHISDFL
jgi:membrane-bound metal-dependent hydrolase YbcI (DUF457 family)